MKLYIFGSCSGTEPYPDRHHTAFALEENGQLYWFDAGENCSYTAHLMGLDLLRVSHVFISHPHMDHVGGLGNLLWTIRKLTYVKDRQPEFGGVTVHIPNMNTWNGILTVLQETEGNFSLPYPLTAVPVADGTLLTDDNLRVTAQHNFHLPESASGWQSYSFRIEGAGKTILYSGDVRSPDDLHNWLQDGCDPLLMESGHHNPEEVCQHIAQTYPNVKAIHFLHHGRRILHDYDLWLARCRAAFPAVTFANDQEVIEL